MGVGSGLQLLIRSSGHRIMVLCLRFSYTSFKNKGMKRREQRGEKRIAACCVGEQKAFLCATCQNTTNMEEWGFLDGLVLFYSFWAKILLKYVCTYPDFPNSGYWIQAAVGGPAVMATSVPACPEARPPGPAEVLLAICLRNSWACGDYAFYTVATIYMWLSKFEYKLIKRNGIKNSVSESHSDQISRSVVSDSLRPHELQHTRPPCPSPTPGVHSDSRPSSQWCHPAISSSVVPFSSCPQSLPATFKVFRGTPLVVQWLRLCNPNAEGLGLIPGQGTRSHMPQLRVPMLHLRACLSKCRSEILYATAKTWCSQVNT